MQKRFKCIVYTIMLCSFFVQEVIAQEWTVKTVSASSQLWPAANLNDGITGSSWSSNGHASANNSEWIAYWFDGFRSVNYIKLYPRIQNGKALGFPTKFTIFWSDGGKWIEVGSYSNVPTPYRSDYIVLPFQKTVSANGIHIVATSLGQDDFGNYFFQAGEVSAGFDERFNKLVYLGNDGSSNEFEIRGMGSGVFDSRKMAVWNYDKRNPIIVAKSATCAGGQPPLSNIYAANVVHTGAKSWNIYFGGYNGTCAEGDDISMTSTADNFQTFSPHKLIVGREIANGIAAFDNINNSSVVRTADGSWRMVYTSYKANTDQNKPAYAVSTDGVNWDPKLANMNNRITMHGYSGWTGEDVNGTNVLYNENGVWHLYWKGFDHPVYHATSSDGKNFYSPNPLKVLFPPSGCFGVNDIKKFGSQYLWAYHCNTSRVWFSLGSTPQSSSAPQLLFDTVVNQPSFGQDPYVVSAGWVADNTRLYGMLYGAGSVPGLNKNRIYARWLQKKAIFDNQNTSLTWMKSNGPDNSVVMMVSGKSIETGTLRILDSDGITPLFVSPPVTVRQGDIWEYRP